MTADEVAPGNATLIGEQIGHDIVGQRAIACFCIGHTLATQTDASPSRLVLCAQPLSPGCGARQAW